MKGKFKTVLLILLYTLQSVVLVSGFFYDVCPRDDYNISPCTCDHEGINCDSVTQVEEIENVFKAKFKYNAIRSFWLQGTPLEEIPNGTFSNIKIQQVYLDYNQITNFDVNILSYSSDYTHTISLYNNQISEFSFESLKSLPLLKSLNLAKNNLTVIPDNAFSSNDQLKEIALQGNKIKNLGQSAFRGLPQLQLLLLGNNVLETLGENSIAFHGNISNLQVDLSSNNIQNISKSAFGSRFPQLLLLGGNKLQYLEKEVFDSMAEKMGDYHGRIDVQGNPLTCRGCEYLWLIANKNLLQYVIVNFFCPDGSSLAQLTRRNIRC